MRRSVALGLLVALAAMSPAGARAQVAPEQSFSLGVILGDPSGVTIRQPLGQQDAIQAHLGLSLFPGDALSLMVDWTTDAWDFLHADHNTASLFLYMGAGAKAEWFTGRYYAYDHSHLIGYEDESHFGIGVRLLFGLRLALLEAPFDLFIEAAPVGVILVSPGPIAYYDVDVALGVRYRF